MFQIKWLRIFVISITLLLAGLFMVPPPMNATPADDLDQNRARLLTYVLRRQIENHFSGKNIDDQLSQAAFELYTKQMDSQKRLLLSGEVDQLKIYADRIDDEVQTGRIVLAPLAFQLLENSIERAERLAEQALAEPFDFSIKESFETDPDKYNFSDTEAELADRWRKDLKFRALNRYLNLLEDAGIEDPLKASPELQKEKEI